MKKYLLAHGKKDYKPDEHDWHYIDDCLPAPLPPSESPSFAPCSPEVLIQDSRGKIKIAFLRWDAQDEYPPEWVQAGRDGYLEFAVRCWRYLPEPRKES